MLHYIANKTSLWSFSQKRATKKANEYNGSTN